MQSADKVIAILIGLAIVAVLVSAQSQTTSVISSAVSVLVGWIGQIMAPLSTSAVSSGAAAASQPVVSSSSPQNTAPQASTAATTQTPANGTGTPTTTINNGALMLGFDPSKFFPGTLTLQ